ncbi:hypothetical protein [Nesterenkonia sp. CF4.4]|uniref:hypothetical protein n=1 Tax=Nesterenkonia sp. CF4.4 TaxID=3373079 RepID=UPI003EE53DC3
MTSFPSTFAARLRRRSTAGAAAGLLGVLVLTGCETSTAEPEGTPAAESSTSNEGLAPQVPEPSGNQLTHDEMREQLAARYPDAALSDTTDYWAGLRDIETELQRLVVDPPECKQFVVRSAVPVPAGALVAYADGLAEGGSEDAEGGTEDGPEDEEDVAESTEGAPEAGAFHGEARVQLVSTEEEDSEGEGDAGSEGEGDAGSEGDGDAPDPENAEDGNAENSGSENSDSENSDSEGGDSEGSDSEDEDEPEPEPITVELPSERQALILTFRDWRAADAHLAAEQDGVESCDSYTASRGGEDSEETSTSVDLVDVSSTADAALGASSRITSDGDREDNLAVTLRSGSHIVTVTAPLSEALDEQEAEVAAEELQAEAAELLESLD